GKAPDEVSDAMVRTVKELFDKYAELSPKMPKEIMLGVMLNENPVALTEFITGNAAFEIEDKQAILEQSDPLERLRLVAEILENENEILTIERDFYKKVREQVDTNQKEYYLREQMKVISEELGEDDSYENEIEEYLNTIAKLNLPLEVAEKLTKETNKLYKTPANSQEAAVIRGYLDECLELPWNIENKIKSDVKAAQKILDRDHYGLQRVKERIVESIAVTNLAPDIKGQILCLVGPPGVGKTSIAKSIAAATGREYVRISLGGVRDEADIRGHRKTYIGSMPGRIIEALKRAKSKNPLMLLDEIDKLGTDYKGDPASALLEVLDSEQNHAFRDHFIELPFDLSKVLFIATANDADNIPAPLYDRMEIIELGSYTREEKLNIAKDYLVPKQRRRHGLTGRNIRISDDAIYGIIDNYTREAGVRKTEQVIAKIMRKAALKIVNGEAGRISVLNENIEDFLGARKYKPEIINPCNMVGVANGLAWTSVGGEMLQIEAVVLDGS
ncbi:MAG: endopeptidase La, partial [Oscillospiraceae bacterium]